MAGERIRVAPRRPAAEQHAAETREVGGGAEQTRVAGDAVHPARGRIVDDRRAGTARSRRLATHGHASGRQRSVGAIRGRSDSGGRNVVSFMPSGSKICGFGILVEPLAADAADDVAEQEEVDVAVDEPLAWRRGRHFLDGAPNRLVGAAELDLELEVGPQAGRVRQQMANR